MFFKKKKKDFLMTDDRLNSVAIICDGNGRWAEHRGLPRSSGHIEGAKRIQPVLETFRKIGVHYVTIYAFSTENWKRPKEEVDGIMDLVYKYLCDVVQPMIISDKEFCMKFLGDKERLPQKLRDKCIEIENMASGRPFVCSLALNYGGRDEIIHAANEAIKAGNTKLTPDIFEKYLYTEGTPDPDLIIRTGGDFRISNFLLWQNAYSEVVVLDTLWPEFGDNEIMESVRRFYGRNRRFGGLNKDNGKK